MKALIVPHAQARALTALQVAELPIPDIRADEVLIEVKAAGLNPVDYKLVEAGVAAWQYPHVLGLDVAGVVRKVGANVTAWQVGDHVCGHGNLAEQGCFAEFAAFKAYALAKIPDAVSFEQASAVLCAGMTAYQAVFCKASLAHRKTVLVHAGAGGVGSVAVQLAKAAGLTVFTTVSGRKADYVKPFAPDAVIDYQTENVDERIRALTQGKGVDLIINTVGRQEATADLARLAYNGALVCVVSPPQLDNPALLFERGLGIEVVNLGGAHRSGNPEQQQALATLSRALLARVAKQELHVAVSETVSLADIPQALQRIKDRQTVGKVIVRI